MTIIGSHYPFKHTLFISILSAIFNSGKRFEWKPPSIYELIFSRSFFFPFQSIFKMASLKFCKISFRAAASAKLIKVTRLKHTLFDGKKLVNIETVSNPISLSSFQFLIMNKTSRFMFTIRGEWGVVKIHVHSSLKLMSFLIYLKAFLLKSGEADLTLRQMCL